MSSDLGNGRLDARGEADARRAVVPLLTPIALAFALGIAAGWDRTLLNLLEERGAPAAAEVVPWLMVAVAGVMAAWVANRRPHARSAFAFAAAAAFACGAAWSELRSTSLAANDLAAWIVPGDPAALVTIEGVAHSAPVLRARTQGSMAAFDYRGPSTYFPVQVESLHARAGEVIRARGRIVARIAEPVAPFRAGDRVRMTGHLLAPEPPRNPGEFDTPAYARALGQAGFLSVPSRKLLVVTPAARSQAHATWLHWRETLQRRASAWLLARLPHAGDGPFAGRDTLLMAIVLGQREPELDGLTETFQRMGIAHLLAISGLHLGILAGLVLAAVRFGGRPRAWHGWLIIALVLGYLVLLEVRLPVLRAGVMTIAASLGLVLARRFSVSGLVALSGVALLIWRPDQVYAAGFQLSYGVVLGLIHFSPVLRERLFGRPDREAASSARMVGQWLLDVSAVAITAWIVATPITVHHFGIVAPLGIPLSVILLPLVAVVLAAGFAKLLLEVALPSAAMLLGVPLAVAADAMLSIVLAADALPGAVWHVPHPSAWWSVAALGVAALWLAPRSGGFEPRLRERLARPRVLLPLTAALILWLLWPMMPVQRGPALRLDMISVGHGACFVLRSGGETFVFDAGSTSNLNIGRQSIVPALRRLGVRRIDTLAISHPHLDHYSAVLELVDEFDVQRVLVTHQFLEYARDRDRLDGSVPSMTDGLTRRFIPMQPVVRDDVRTVGDATLTWLHPPLDLERFRRDNEHSMVVRLDVAGRIVVLCGDVERAGLAALLEDAQSIDADVIELPHHGGWSELTAEFVSLLNPAVVMQSCSRVQWERDRWAERLRDAERLVTWRDGACWVEIDADGEIRLGRFRE